jgi:hypothetical protein|tara:strand:- start:1652 stop:2074 length:423 start_codon:yes stop_codon:yes gene_type:complete
LKKRNIEKSYYSMHDTSIYGLLTAKFQHQLIEVKSIEKEGKILFYSGEDPVYNKMCRVIRDKLEQKPKVNGFIFIHLQQFGYSGNLDFSLIKKILKLRYELHFCKEDLSLKNLNDFKKNYDNLLIYNNSLSQKSLKSKIF